MVKDGLYLSPGFLISKENIDIQKIITELKKI